MRRMVEKILKCYGREVYIPRLNGGVYAFLQSVRGKGQHLVVKEVGPLGMEQGGQYVYIGPVEPELLEEDVLQTDGKAYLVRRTEVVCGSGGPAYRWAMCVQQGGDDRWGSSG